MFGHRQKQPYQDDDTASLSPGQTFDIADAAISPMASHISGGPFNWMTGTFAGLDVAVSGAHAYRYRSVTKVAGAISAQAAGVAGYYVGGAVGKIVGGTLGAVIAGPAGAAIGAFAGDLAGNALGPFFLDQPARRFIERPTKAVLNWGRGHVQFGGFRDSQPAYSMRQKSLQELQGSLLNARQYFGKEAQLFHQ